MTRFKQALLDELVAHVQRDPVQRTPTVPGPRPARAVAVVAAAITAALKRESWALLFFEAAVGFAAALWIVLWPGLPMMGLVSIISGWGLATGAPAMIYAARLRRYHRGKWLLALSGTSAIALGVVMIAVPLAGPPAIAFWLRAYAFTFGALLVALVLRLSALIASHRKTQWKRAA